MCKATLRPVIDLTYEGIETSEACTIKVANLIPVIDLTYEGIETVKPITALNTFSIDQ